jgi:FkbM family methyltransferase
LPDDGVVLDVGANLGFLCVHLARCVPRGRVIAFEPLPDNHRVLGRVLHRFGVRNAEVYPWALGDQNGEATMVLPVHHRARQQGLGHVVDPGTAGEPGIPFVVPMRRLDDLPQVNADGARVVAMKIDVENSERNVLRGATEILRRHRPVVYLELWDNDNRAECFAIATRLSYRVMVSDAGRLVPFDPTVHRRHGNFFFMPQEVPPARSTSAAAQRRRVQPEAQVTAMASARMAEGAGDSAVPASNIPQAG